MKVLRGVKVLELATALSGPYCGMLLGDLGADVIKVERPDGGDPFRQFQGGLYSAAFAAFNKNKRSITLDLNEDEDRRKLDALLITSDVILDNFRPGVMERLGLHWERVHGLNSRLIQCSITGFGNTGPYRGRPAFDTVAGGLSGLLNLFLDPREPRVVGPTISDNVAGLYAAYGILGALYERTLSGVGRRVEVNMLESVMAFMPETFSMFRAGIQVDRESRVASSQAFTLRCRDGKIVGIHLSVPEKFWRGFCRALEREELATDPRFTSRQSRVANYGELRLEVECVAATKPRAYWCSRLLEFDVPFASINDVEDVLDDEQVATLGTFYATEHPTQGEVISIRRPVLIDGERAVDDLPPPVLGEHNDEILNSPQPVS